VYPENGKKADIVAEKKRHFICILCGDNFVMRRINTIFDAKLAEKNKYVFIQ